MNVDGGLAGRSVEKACHEMWGWKEGTLLPELVWRAGVIWFVPGRLRLKGGPKNNGASDFSTQTINEDGRLTQKVNDSRQF